MNRDTTIIQVSVLMIAVAILWIAIRRQQNPTTTEPSARTQPIKIQEQIRPDSGAILLVSGTIVGSWLNAPTKNALQERANPDRANLVKQYFRHIAAKEFKEACALMSPGKCAAIRPAAVTAFAQEFLKLKNGYEYLSVRDYWLQSPSGKDVVCVKYSYRYKDDGNPWLISEVLSFYIEEDVGKRVIANRVCEKKYKEWSGNRPCPVEATQNFCANKIR